MRSDVLDALLPQLTENTRKSLVAKLVPADREEADRPAGSLERRASGMDYAIRRIPACESPNGLPQVPTDKFNARSPRRG